jgi:hypothetical protein
MARPRKINPDDLDVYNEEALNQQLLEEVSVDLPADPEQEDVVPELGEAGEGGGFGDLSDEESFRYHE